MSGLSRMWQGLLQVLFSSAKNRAELIRESMELTNDNLNIILAATGFFFPIFLWFILPAERQHELVSISHAYTIPDLNIFFVGFLSAMVMGMFAHNGANGFQNLILNLAAIFLLGVIYFPVDETSKTWNGLTHHQMHLRSATSFFACIIIIVFHGVIDGYRRGMKFGRTFNGAYLLTGIIMILTICFGALDFWYLNNEYFFWVELLGVFTFALYWSVKFVENFRSTDREGHPYLYALLRMIGIT